MSKQVLSMITGSATLPRKPNAAQGRVAHVGHHAARIQIANVDVFNDREPSRQRLAAKPLGLNKRLRHQTRLRRDSATKPARWMSERQPLKPKPEPTQT